MTSHPTTAPNLDQAPAVWHASADDPALPEFVAGASAALRAELDRRGAVLLRGWPAAQAGGLDDVVRAMGGSTMDYRDAATPRSSLGSGVYTSTDYPASEWIELHNEACYAATWPGLLYFGCVQPAEDGGATTVADTRAILAGLPERLVRRLREQGVCYVRTFHPRLGLPWQEVLGTSDPDEAVRLCQERGMRAEWLADDVLRTSVTWPALLPHPRTGDECWFNQIVAFHPGALPADLRSVLVRSVGADRLPKQVRFGDGAEIPAEVLAEIKRVCDEHTVPVRWQAGDVLLVDNIRRAHGRAPFRGPRRVLVAMSHPEQWADHHREAIR